LYCTSVTQLVGFYLCGLVTDYYIYFLSSSNKERSTTCFGLISDGHLQVVQLVFLVDLSAVVGDEISPYKSCEGVLVLIYYYI
jgi:hypothetical protein